MKTTSQEVKICPQCEEEKPLSEFHNRAEFKDGHQNICKSCISENQATSYYWKKTDAEGYDKFNYNRQKYLKEIFPDVKYNSFTSYISRSTDIKTSELSRECLKREVEYWLSIKKKKRGNCE